MPEQIGPATSIVCILGNGKAKIRNFRKNT
jgi:hypothetical protein